MQLLEERLAQMERKLMGPNAEYQTNSNHTSDDENVIHSTSAPTSNRAHSPIRSPGTMYTNGPIPAVI